MSRGQGAGAARSWAALDGRDNALNFLRLVLAATVIVVHSWGLSGAGANELAVHTGDVAVMGFFAISGYLITASRLRLPVGTYLWRRLLRIGPGYWVCLVVVAFVIVPVSTVFSGQPYPVGEAARWVAAAWPLTGEQGAIGTTLATAPYPRLWDGPLWTIAFEMACYIAAGILLAFRWFRLAAATALCGASSLLLVVAVNGTELPNVVVAGARLGACFAAGMMVFLSGWQPRGVLVAGAAASLLALAGLGWIAFVIASPIPFAVVLLWLGRALPFRVGARNDVSYGVYLYGWPVQQLLAIAGLGVLGVLGFAAVSLVAVLPLALTSWFLVERRAVRLRRLVPVAGMAATSQTSATVQA
ncbi:acyltransferase family protein [Monashia sp. NPDC004114]